MDSFTLTIGRRGWTCPASREPPHPWYHIRYYTSKGELREWQSQTDPGIKMMMAFLKGQPLEAESDRVVYAEVVRRMKAMTEEKRAKMMPMWFSCQRERNDMRAAVEKGGYGGWLPFASPQIRSFVTVEEQIEAEDNAKMDAWLATLPEAVTKGLAPPGIYHSNGTVKPAPEFHPDPDGFQSRLGLRGGALPTRTKTFTPPPSPTSSWADVAATPSRRSSPSRKLTRLPLSKANNNLTPPSPRPGHQRVPSATEPLPPPKFGYWVSSNKPPSLPSGLAPATDQSRTLDGRASLSRSIADENQRPREWFVGSKHRGPASVCGDDNYRNHRSEPNSVSEIGYGVGRERCELERELKRGPMLGYIYHLPKLSRVTRGTAQELYEAYDADPKLFAAAGHDVIIISSRNGMYLVVTISSYKLRMPEVNLLNICTVHSCPGTTGTVGSCQQENKWVHLEDAPRNKKRCYVYQDNTDELPKLHAYWVYPHWLIPAMWFPEPFGRSNDRKVSRVTDRSLDLIQYKTQNFFDPPPNLLTQQISSFRVSGV